MNEFDSVYMSLVREAANDKNWAVVKSKDESELLNDFWLAVKKHMNACKEMFNMPNIKDLDSHKQAAALCVAVLEASPLRDISKTASKKAMYWRSNEYVAMELGRYHVRRDMRQKPEYAPFGAELDKMPQIATALKNDIKGYTLSFLRLLHEERLLSKCSIFQKHDLKEKYCSKEDCAQIDKCTKETLFNYASLATLFYHYEILVADSLQ